MPASVGQWQQCCMLMSGVRSRSVRGRQTFEAGPWKTNTLERFCCEIKSRSTQRQRANFNWKNKQEFKHLAFLKSAIATLPTLALRWSCAGALTIITFELPWVRWAPPVWWAAHLPCGDPGAAPAWKIRTTTPQLPETKARAKQIQPQVIIWTSLQRFYYLSFLSITSFSLDILELFTGVSALSTEPENQHASWEM